MHTAILLAGLPAADPPTAGTAQLVLAALLGIAVVVVLITVMKVHLFLALILGSSVLGVVGALDVSATIDSFTKAGSTVGSAGLLVALGDMIGDLLPDSGGDDGIVDTIVQWVGNGALSCALGLRRKPAPHLMTPPFRFSAAIPRYTGNAVAWRDDVRRAEDTGLDTLTISDHFTKGWTLEPIVALTVAAHVTSSLRLQSLVLGNDYRHPVLLHKAMATLDVLSGGRVDIGIGAGWMPSDYAAAGIPLDPPGVRVERLREAIAILRGLFGAEPFSFVGQHYRIKSLNGLPKPAQKPSPPILVGGGGPRVLALAGEMADIVAINASLRPGTDSRTALEDLSWEGVEAKLDWARAAADAAQRRPAYQISIMSLELTDTPNRASASSSLAQDVDPARVANSPAVLRGTVAACAERLHEVRERLGISHFHLGNDLAAAARLRAAMP